MNVATLATSVTRFFKPKSESRLPSGLVGDFNKASGIQKKIANLLALTEQLRLDGAGLRKMRDDLNFSFVRLVKTFGLSRERSKKVIADALGLNDLDAETALDAANWDDHSIERDDFTEKAEEIQSLLQAQGAALEKQISDKAAKLAKQVQNELWDMQYACGPSKKSAENRGLSEYWSVMAGHQLRLGHSLAHLAERLHAEPAKRAELMKNLETGSDAPVAARDTLEAEDFFTVAEEVLGDLRDTRAEWLAMDPVQFSRESADPLLEKFGVRDVTLRAVNALAWEFARIRKASLARPGELLTVGEERTLEDIRQMVEALRDDATWCAALAHEDVASYARSTAKIHNASGVGEPYPVEADMAAMRAQRAEFAHAARRRTDVAQDGTKTVTPTIRQVRKAAVLQAQEAPGRAKGGAETLAKLFAPFGLDVRYFQGKIAEKAAKAAQDPKKYGGVDAFAQGQRHANLAATSEKALSFLQNTLQANASQDAVGTTTFRQVWGRKTQQDAQAA